MSTLEKYLGKFPFPELTLAWLFLTCALFSLLHLSMMLVAYVKLKDHVPYSMIAIHTLLVAKYALQKEHGRWTNGSHSRNWPGHALVFLWLGILAAMYVHAFFWRDGKGIPEGMVEMTGLLLGVFGATELSKHHYANKKRCPGQDETPAPEETKTTP